jgi:hypothetical protein
VQLAIEIMRVAQPIQAVLSLLALYSLAPVNALYDGNSYSMPYSYEYPSMSYSYEYPAMSYSYEYPSMSYSFEYPSMSYSFEYPMMSYSYEYPSMSYSMSYSYDFSYAPTPPPVVTSEPPSPSPTAPPTNQSEPPSPSPTVPPTPSKGSPICTLDQIRSQIFFADAANFCLKITVGEDIIGDGSDTTCDDKNGSGVIFSTFDGFVGGRLQWAAGPGGFSGNMTIQENPTLMEPNLIIHSYVPSTQVFDVTLEVPSCDRTTCHPKELLGSEFFAPFAGHCFRIPFFYGATLYGDNTDSACDFKTGAGIPFSTFNSFLPGTNVAEFIQGPAGYDGVMSVVRDHTLTKPQLRPSPSGALAGQSFNVTLAIPECPEWQGS